MRAWILEEQASVEERPLKLVEVPTPHPKDNEIRLKVVACGVCRTDIHIAEGDLQLRKAPTILGHEIVGMVDEAGGDVLRFNEGDKAGVYWLHSSCGTCKYCLSGRENYCPEIQCTGWDRDGGYAEYVTVPAAYALALNDVQMDALEIAPLLCPGIAGYAAFKLAGVQKGGKLGLYGFGPTAYCVLKVAQAQGRGPCEHPFPEEYRICGERGCPLGSQRRERRDALQAGCSDPLSPGWEPGGTGPVSTGERRDPGYGSRECVAHHD
jgi:propanol-preferring alcohol dehydrogenase